MLSEKHIHKQAMHLKKLIYMFLKINSYHVMNEIQTFLKEQNVEFESSRQFLIGKKLILLYMIKKLVLIQWFKIYEWFGKKDRNYHINKTISCNEKRIRINSYF